MAVLVFVLVWASIAVGLVVIGIRSGRRGKPSDVQTRRGGRAYWYVGFAVVLLGFGVGIPVAAGLGRDSDSRRVPQADISDLTSDQEHGRELFHKFCSVCHSLEAANAVAQVGPNLDERVGPIKTARQFVLSTIQKGRAQGNGAMAPNLVTGKDAEDVADFVAAAVGQTGK